jgi:hypothetical protein
VGGVTCPDRIVGVRVRYEESQLQATVKERGGRWDNVAKVWRMPYRLAVRLGLRSRVVKK